MKHFNWMVFDHINKMGIYWYGTKTHLIYVFYWNPLRNLAAWLSRWDECSFGWFPMKKSHINF